MSNGIFGIGISGLAAAQAGLLTTSHNISNVNTPGYSRQETLQDTRTPRATGSGFFGQGVDVSSVRRVYSDFLTSQTLQAQASASHMDAYSTQLSQLANLFGDSATGLAPALAGFFASVNAVAANPADMPSRQSMLSSAQAMVGRFAELSQQLENTRDGVNAQITGGVATINTIAASIASLNRQIGIAGAGVSGTQPPNDLLDQRDGLMTQLNGLLGATSTTQADGNMNVFLPNGQALVAGNKSFVLTATPDNDDPQKIQIGLQVGSSVAQFHAADLQGGTLGGLLAYRDGTLDAVANSLGRTALVMAQSFNDQHRLGLDRSGQPGRDFFTVPVPKVQDATTNNGTAVIGATLADAGALTESDYRLSYDGTSYTLTRLSDNTTTSLAALPQVVDGIQLDLTSGSPAAGDSFLIQPTRYAAGALAVSVSDPALIAAAAPVRTAITATNSGTAAISAGSVDASYLAAPLSGPLTLTYSSATGKLSWLPASHPVTVTVGNVTTSYAAGVPVPYTAGATIASGGISFVLTGAPSDGDTFSIAPNALGVGDNRNAQLLASLQSRNVAANGTTTIGGTYTQMVSFVGNAAHQAQVEAQAQNSILTQSQQAAQSVSGVNLDEEAANLQRYQQAYQAAGKVLATAAALFDTILNISNR